MLDIVKVDLDAPDNPLNRVTQPSGIPLNVESKTLAYSPNEIVLI